MFATILGITRGAAVTTPARRGSVTNADTVSVGYDVLSGIYTPAPVDARSDTIVTLSNDVQPLPNGDWITNNSAYDTPARSMGVSLPVTKVAKSDVGQMLANGYMVTRV